MSPSAACHFALQAEILFIGYSLLDILLILVFFVPLVPFMKLNKSNFQTNKAQHQQSENKGMPEVILLCPLWQKVLIFYTYCCAPTAGKAGGGRSLALTTRSSRPSRIVRLHLTSTSNSRRLKNVLFFLFLAIKPVSCPPPILDSFENSPP